MHLLIWHKPILLQALVEDPPVHPNDVLREIVDLAQLPILQEEPPSDTAELLQYQGDDDEMDEQDHEFADDVSPVLSGYGQSSQQADYADDKPDESGNVWDDDRYTDADFEDDDVFDTDAFDAEDRRSS